MRRNTIAPRTQIKISTSLAHGGDVREGKRKIRRPFDSKRPLHIVFRSSRARGEWSMLKPKHRDLIERLLDRLSKKYSIQVHRFANVGNHLHLLISALTRAELQNFLRQFTGEVAARITHASKSNPVGRFWDKLVFTRVVGCRRRRTRVRCDS